jgi:predicted acyl esterase
MSLELEQILSLKSHLPARLPEKEVERTTVRVAMRDGIQLATDIHRARSVKQGPTIAIRTPYDRRADKGELAHALAQYGYVGIVQDVRGTGDSEPKVWDSYVFELEDSYDHVEWITRQDWYDGFIGSAGLSYEGGTQWCMSFHPKMTAIAPEVAGIGGIDRGVNLHMALNAYARSVGHGENKVAISYEEMERQILDETLATGYFNPPLEEAANAALPAEFPELRKMSPPASWDWLWEKYCGSPPAERARMLKSIMGADEVNLWNLDMVTAFGPRHVDEHITPYATVPELYRSLRSQPLLISGWYDWGLDATLRTWELISRYAPERVREGARLFIAPSAHDATGYHEGPPDDPVLSKTFRRLENVELLAGWYGTVRAGGEALSRWPRVVYYLMGAGEWRTSADWPPPQMHVQALYIGAGGRLSPATPEASTQDEYVYDPEDPTPTLGGTLFSAVYTPGSTDVSRVQARPDVLTYTTAPLERDLDVAGPVRFILFASSSAVDTDFVVRLSDVFPDGRAINLQNGIIRARYRNPEQAPSLLEPGRVYELDVDVWATANRFRAGHRVRVDVSSADFPKYDRNSNLGGAQGKSAPARQRIFHDPEHPSRLLLPVLGRLE